ncbi:MAG: glycosyltransferase [Bacteroidota bacterium]|jgi:glycosyltransferase involved in cell wall biosynthesis
MSTTSDKLQGRDFIVFSVLPWVIETGSNSKNISIELALSGNRVLYVDPPLDRITAIREGSDPNVKRKKEVLRKKQQALRQDPAKENIWLYDPEVVLESLNFLPDGSLYDYLNQNNAKKLANCVQKASDALGFKDYIVFVDSDMLRCCFIKDYLNAKTYLYYTRDYLQGVPFWQRHGKRLEPVHMAKADGVVANSEYLKAWAEKFNPHSYYIGQGCNIEHFNPDKNWALPNDWPKNERPKIVYTGFHTTLRLDLNLLIGLVETRPEWDWLFVGAEDKLFQESSLHGKPNVYFLGKKSIAELPAYIKYATVCINPQQLNDITKGNYPLKINEYLAMGKPSVATRTEFMKSFSGHCLLADGVTEWSEVIEKAILSESIELAKARRLFALAHSWENNVKEIYKVINQIETER